MPDVPPVRRRTALAGALGSVAATVLAAGCDHGDDIGSPPASSGPSATSQSSPPSSAPAETPDEALVDSTIEQLNAAVGVLVAARRFPALRRPLAPLIRAHRRHVEVLEGEVQRGVSPTLGDQAAALAAVHRSERQLQGELVVAAGRAESGALAKLIASMSASVTQFLVALPPEGAG
ncbi:MAG TPA: hypothetical protein VFI19_13455 [Nocardioides sp.]|nr:hypothetical protein [Nocardioides sp.]